MPDTAAPINDSGKAPLPTAVLANGSCLCFMLYQGFAFFEMRSWLNTKSPTEDEFNQVSNLETGDIPQLQSRLSPGENRDRGLGRVMQ